MLLWGIDPLPGKDLERNNETTTVAMQRRCKHASTTTNLRLEKVFSSRSVQSGYKENNWGDPMNCQLKVEFCTGGCEGRN
jgi:hypothetical protein